MAFLETLATVGICQPEKLLCDHFSFLVFSFLALKKCHTQLPIDKFAYR